MRVGTSLRGDGWVLERKDHPHACGDKSFIDTIDLLLVGSSPCVWGQGRNKLAIFAVSRIIPMRVGTRFGNVRNAKRNWDHPHACGDKVK